MRLGGGLLFVLAASACGRLHFDELGDGAIDPLVHVTVAPGWTKNIFVDFSANHDYSDTDFSDTTDIANNAPKILAVLGPPFAEVLAVGAGRSIIELSATTYVAHDFGMHAPNAANPDDITRMSLVPDAGGVGPRLVVASSTQDSGDGLFFVDAVWAIARDMTTNNVRTFAWDEAGIVDGTPQTFVGTGSGMVRRSDDSVVLAPGDFRSMLALPGALVFSRNVGFDDQRLVQATWNGTAFVEAQLAMRGFIDFADGDRPSGRLVWAVIELGRLDEVALDGTTTDIAMTTVPEFEWKAAAVPPIGHALAPAKRSIYVLESNRALDIDRVLVFTQD